MLLKNFRNTYAGKGSRINSAWGLGFREVHSVKACMIVASSASRKAKCSKSYSRCANLVLLRTCRF